MPLSWESEYMLIPFRVKNHLGRLGFAGRKWGVTFWMSRDENQSILSELWSVSDSWGEITVVIKSEVTGDW